MRDILHTAQKPRDALTAPPRERDFVRCHQDVLAGTFASDPAAVAEWQQHITHLVEVPALRATDRFRRDALAAWLLAPHDLTPLHAEGHLL